MRFAQRNISNRNQVPMTLDLIRQYAPSAFATEAHESRSSRYTYIPTVDVIEGMQRNGFQVMRASQSSTRDASRHEFTKHMIRFRPENLGSLVVGDTFPEVVLVNSHDGTSAYKLMAGIFRLVCLNGMVTSDGHQRSISVHHKGDIIDRVVSVSHEIMTQAPKALNAIREWSQLQLTAGEQNALAESAHYVRFADSEGKVSTPITPAQLLQPRRSEDTKSDLWTAFNRVQENVIRGGLHGVQRDTNGRSVRRVSTREVKGIDQDVKLNRALWQLAERMAELKQVQVAA